MHLNDGREVFTVSLREYCYAVWDEYLPKSHRQAKSYVVDREITDATLMVYYAKWRKDRGFSKPRPHRRGKGE
jgi:hypothetical protein